MGLFSRKDSEIPTTENCEHWFAPAPNGTGAPTIGKSADTVLVLKKTLYEFGRERALASKDTHPNEAVLRSLEEHAEAMAREQGATLFDPSESLHDRLRQEKFEAARSQIPKSEAEVAQAADDVRKRRDALAELGEVPAPPEAPWLLFLFGTLLIGLTCGPTLHDYFFADLEDQRLSWVFSILAGSFAGLVISWCLLATFASTSRVTRWVGLAAGIVFGLALFIIRMIGGEGGSTIALAVGLALLELAVVLLMDWVGSGLREQYAEYRHKAEEYDRRLKVFQAGEEELAAREKCLSSQKVVVEEHLEHLRDRESRVKQVDSLVRGARQAVRDGYFAGLAENEGRIRGHNI